MLHSDTHKRSRLCLEIYSIFLQFPCDSAEVAPSHIILLLRQQITRSRSAVPWSCAGAFTSARCNLLFCTRVLFCFFSFACAGLVCVARAHSQVSARQVSENNASGSTIASRERGRRGETICQKTRRTVHPFTTVGWSALQQFLWSLHTSPCCHCFYVQQRGLLRRDKVGKR